MKYLRIVVLILLVLSIGIFAYAEYGELTNIDRTKPVITGSTDTLQLTCDYTEEELLAGLTAYDDKDGDLTDEIMVGSITRFHEKGKSNVTYVVFDSANQPATFTREVEFTDYTSPEIEIITPLVYTEGSGDDFFTHLGATDVLDGDLSSLVRVTDSNVNYLSEGTYSIKTEVTNSFGDLVEMILPVHIVDVIDTRIEITLRKNIVYLEKDEEFNPRTYIQSATLDARDYDKSKIKIESHVKTDTPGCYEVKYSADDGKNRGAMWLVVVVR